MRIKFKSWALFSVIFAAIIPAYGSITRYSIGDRSDVRPALFGPALNLGGGGTDVDPAIQWMVDSARGCTSCSAKVDVVVLRTSGSDGYNAPIMAMNGVDSVETFVLTSRRDAMNQTVVSAISNAEVVFFAGGDQCSYVQLFRNTRVSRAVRSVYVRGGAVGGTSAGEMIQGEFVYDACGGSAVSSQALANPYDPSISFTSDLFDWPDLRGALAESHFSQRDRMGRLMAFLARQIKDGRSSSALGIAANEATSVVIGPSGVARVMGNVSGRAYFVLADHMPEVCAPGSPLTYSNFKIWRLQQGETFDLRARPTTGSYLISVNAGVLSGNPY